MNWLRDADLDDDYMATATQDVGTQLSKGGVRLAFISDFPLTETTARTLGRSGPPTAQ